MCINKGEGGITLEQHSGRMKGALLAYNSPSLLKEVNIMNLSDIIELAKKGYKPNDIKELIELANTSTQEEDSPVEKEIEEEVPQEPVEKEDPEEVKDDSKDKEILELKQKLAQAQKDNRNKDLSEDKKSDEDLIENLVRSFM